MNPKLEYTLFALMMLFFLLIFVPRLAIKKLFWFGMFWGSTLDFLIETVFSLLNILRYEHIQPFNIGRLPVWTVLGWTPAAILFVYFLPQRKERYIFWLYIIMFSGLTACIGAVLSQLKLLVFINWSVIHWFVMGIAFYYLQARHYFYLENSVRN